MNNQDYSEIPIFKTSRLFQTTFCSQGGRVGRNLPLAFSKGSRMLWCVTQTAMQFTGPQLVLAYYNLDWFSIECPKSNQYLPIRPLNQSQTKVKP